MKSYARRSFISSIVVALACAGLACSGSDDKGGMPTGTNHGGSSNGGSSGNDAGSGGNNGTTSDPEKACLDTANVVATAAQRCGEDYQANYDAFLQAGAGGSCANIIQVRDETALRQTCLPWIQSAACSDLLGGNYDPSCVAQLLRPASASTSQVSSWSGVGAVLGEPAE
ncbi:MAG TPA: hypothetical protein VNO21_20055 [Polyangiaceae bacterium]|nr:hypothetical protein [Polyangiaceae bacterium]